MNSMRPILLPFDWTQRRKKSFGNRCYVRDG
jgi:hypothetical protein